MLLDTILDADTFGRLVATASAAHEDAIILLFDIVEALPNIARAFLWEALEATGAPPAIHRFLKTAYDDGRVWLPRPKPHEVCRATSGIAQGCTLSSLLYIIASDALLRALQATLGAALSASCVLVRTIWPCVLARCSGRGPWPEFCSKLNRGST